MLNFVNITDTCREKKKFQELHTYQLTNFRGDISNGGRVMAILISNMAIAAILNFVVSYLAL